MKNKNSKPHSAKENIEKRDLWNSRTNGETDEQESSEIISGGKKRSFISEPIKKGNSTTICQNEDIESVYETYPVVNEISAIKNEHPQILDPKSAVMPRDFCNQNKK